MIWPITRPRRSEVLYQKCSAIKTAFGTMCEARVRTATLVPVVLSICIDELLIVELMVDCAVSESFEPWIRQAVASGPISVVSTQNTAKIAPPLTMNVTLTPPHSQ